MISKESAWFKVILSVSLYLLLVIGSGSGGRDVSQNSVSLGKEKLEDEKLHNAHSDLLDGNEKDDAGGLFSILLNLPFSILNTSDQLIINLGKRWIPLEAQNSFRESGIENPTCFFVFNSCLGFLIIYLLVKLTSSKAEVDLMPIKGALDEKESAISKLNAETKTMLEELEDLEKKLEDKEKEEEKLTFEEDELKLKMEEVMKERDELEKESEKLKAKVKEDVERLEELKEKRNNQTKKNKSMKDELSKLKMSHKAILEEIAKKESELSKPREVLLEEKLQKVTARHSNLLQDKEKASENLKHLTERIGELSKEKERLEKTDEQNSLWLDHLVKENNIFEPALRRLKTLEEMLDTPEDVNGGDDNIANKLGELADKSAVDKMASSGKEELMVLKQAVDAELDDNTILAAKVEKYKSELDGLVQSYKQAEKASKMVSIKLEVLTSHFKDREKDLTSKLSELEERDFQGLDDCQSNKDRINQLMQLAHHHKTEAEVLQKEIEIAESNYKEKLAILEKKAQESWFQYRLTDKNAKGLQQEVDGLRAQTQEAREELEKAEEKYSLVAPKVSRPLPMMPFPPRLPLGRPFLPPPPLPPFLPILRPPELENSSLRSTPFNHLERQYGPSPALTPRPMNDNNSSPSTPGSRRRAQPRSQP